MSGLVLARRVVVALSGLWAAVLLFVFASRVAFPLELEWMEGGALLQALRLGQGETIYGPPSADYVPHLYPPLYPALLAALGLVLPLDFWLGRALSITAVVGVCAALWRLAGREGKPWAHSAAAVGLFLSGYVFTFRWLDLARIDSLFLALSLWGLVVLREAAGSPRRLAAAGTLLALACWTKQTALALALAGALAGVVVAPRRHWVFVATFGALAGGVLAVGQAVTDGWLWTWIYELHQRHAFNGERFWIKTWGMFAHAAPFLLGLLGVAVLDAARSPPAARRRAGLLYWGGMALAGLFVSALGYSTQWAEPNAFIPGVALGAAFLAVALPVSGRREEIGLWLVAAQLAFALFVEPRYQPIQDRGLAGLADSYAWQDPARSIPPAGARARAGELRGALSASEGEVLALHRPWWNAIAGGAGHAGTMGLNDIAPEQRQPLQEAIARDVAAGRYSAIWLEGEPPGWLRGPLRRSYRLAERRHGEERVRPLTGYMSEAGMVTPYEADQLLYVRAEPRS